MTEAPYSTQGWNRYAYVGNSPLNFNDPSGFCFMGCFWQKPFNALGKLLRSTPIVGQLLTIAAAAACSPVGLSAVCGSFASAAVSGLASGDIGQALRAGLIAASTAVAFNVAGDLTGGLPGAIPLENGGYKLEFLSEAHVFNIAAHAAVGCGSAVASGGECGPGALSGAAGSFATPLSNGLSPNGRLVVTTVAGGVASVAGGGKFGNGAVTAAFGYLFNNAVHDYDRGQQQPQGTQTAFCAHPVCLAGQGLAALLGLGYLFSEESHPGVLYHYTTQEGMDGIVTSGMLNASTKVNNPNDVRYGNGQYLSDIFPGTKKNVSTTVSYIYK